MHRIHRNFITYLLVGDILLTSVLITQPAQADSQKIGINVLLNRAVDAAILTDLSNRGKVLDIIPEIKAVTLNAESSELPAIQALPYVVTASPDVECELADGDVLPVPDLFDGANQWSLDAINVTDFGGGRTVGYDGTGVYVAVLGTGLVHNWRSYFPEQRIATQFARAFNGGGGEAKTVSEQPEKWEHDTDGHETAVTSVILGFHYAGSENLPIYFNGVAPKATIIPVRVGFASNNHSSHWESLIAHAIVYVTNLKVSGALGGAPLVINLSNGLHQPLALERAAINYAIGNGVVVVAGAGNEANRGMRNPGAFPEVISAGSTGWVGEFRSDDPGNILWILQDVAENDVLQHFIAPDSSREHPGQDLDVVAPGWMIPVPFSSNGQVDYTFFEGTSFATPHLSGVVALMLQKNPNLMQAQIEAILESTAMPLPPGSRDVMMVGAGPGNLATWGDHNNIFYFPATFSWGANATGHGLVQADAALAATPLP